MLTTTKTTTTVTGIVIVTLMKNLIEVIRINRLISWNMFIRNCRFLSWIWRSWKKGRKINWSNRLIGGLIKIKYLTIYQKNIINCLQIKWSISTTTQMISIASYNQTTTTKTKFLIEIPPILIKISKKIPQAL